MKSVYDKLDENQYLPLAITAIRQYYQLSRTQMAKKIKVSSQCVTKMETTQYRINDEILYRYVNLFNGMVYGADVYNLGNALNKLYNQNEDDKEYIIENDLKGSSTIIVDIFTWVFNQRHCNLKDLEL